MIKIVAFIIFDFLVNCKICSKHKAKEKFASKFALNTIHSYYQLNFRLLKITIF